MLMLRLKHNENLENSEISKNTFDEVINDCDEEYTLMKNNYLSMYPDADINNLYLYSTSIHIYVGLE